MLTIEQRDPASPYFGGSPEEYPFRVECDNNRCQYSFVTAGTADNLKFDQDHVCDRPREENEMSYAKYCRIEGVPTGGGTSALSMMWRLVDEDMTIIMNPQGNAADAVQSAKDRARGAAALMSVTGNKGYRTPVEVSIHAMRRYRMIQAGELKIGEVHNYNFDISEGDDISPELRRVIGWPEGHKQSCAHAPWTPSAGPWREEWLRLEAARATVEGINTPSPEDKALKKVLEGVTFGETSTVAVAKAETPPAEPETVDQILVRLGITLENYNLIKVRTEAGFTAEMLATAMGVTEAQVKEVVSGP